MKNLCALLPSSPTTSSTDAEWGERQRAEKAAAFFEKNWPLANAPTRAYERIKAKDLHGVEWQAANARIKAKLAKRRGSILALVGTRGPGKTQLGVCAMHRNCLDCRSALYVKALDFFAEVKAAYHPGSKEEERNVIRRFCRPRLLVIDGLEERGDTAWEDRMLSLVIDRRYDDMTDTILIANLKQDAFLESIGPSAESRLRETGGIIPCEWPSFRV